MCDHFLKQYISGIKYLIKITLCRVKNVSIAGKKFVNNLGSRAFNCALGTLMVKALFGNL